MNPFEEYLGDLDVSKYTTMSFKMNLTADVDQERLEDIVKTLYFYARQCGDDSSKYYISAGQHLQGKNEVPHIHVNVCVPNFKKDSNESRRRNKYFSEVDETDMTGLTCKVKPIDDISKFEACLKYAWKEKLPVIVKLPRSVVLPEAVKLFMLESAASLFESSKAEERKRERAGERSKTLSGMIQEIIKNKTFSDYEEYVKFVSEEFYGTLDEDDYVDFVMFKKALQKKAVKTGICKPWKFLL